MGVADLPDEEYNETHEQHHAKDDAKRVPRRVGVPLRGHFLRAGEGIDSHVNRALPLLEHIRITLLRVLNQPEPSTTRLIAQRRLGLRENALAAIGPILHRSRHARLPRHRVNHRDLQRLHNILAAQLEALQKRGVLLILLCPAPDGLPPHFELHVRADPPLAVEAGEAIGQRHGRQGQGDRPLLQFAGVGVHDGLPLLHFLQELGVAVGLHAASVLGEVWGMGGG